MAPFSIPVPLIVPLCLPTFSAKKILDRNTKVELMCETRLQHEIFYTLDGTKPEPYSGIVQGSKLFKYKSPFSLPPGKITIKAIALNPRNQAMRSNVVTKCFEVTKAKERQKMTQKKRIRMEDLPHIVIDSPKSDYCDENGDDCEDGSREELSAASADVPQEDASSESEASSILQPPAPPSPETGLLEDEELVGVYEEDPLQCCPSCNSPNSSDSQFCGQCGQRLARPPQWEEESCQYCGKKKLQDEQVETSVAAAGVQHSPASADGQTQTECRTPPPPSHSPGKKRYWHQQLDYICNHLKAHAYNDEEFRASVSEPVLGDIRSVSVSRQEEGVAVTLVFTPCSPGASLKSAT